MTAPVAVYTRLCIEHWPPLVTVTYWPADGVKPECMLSQSALQLEAGRASRAQKARRHDQRPWPSCLRLPCWRAAHRRERARRRPVNMPIAGVCRGRGAPDITATSAAAQSLAGQRASPVLRLAERGSTRWTIAAHGTSRAAAPHSIRKTDRRAAACELRQELGGAAFSTIRWLIASGAATRNGAAVASLSVVAAIAMPALFAAIARLTSASAESKAVTPRDASTPQAPRKNRSALMLGDRLQRVAAETGALVAVEHPAEHDQPDQLMASQSGRHADRIRRHRQLDVCGNGFRDGDVGRAGVDEQRLPCRHQLDRRIGKTGLCLGRVIAALAERAHLRRRRDGAAINPTAFAGLGELAKIAADRVFRHAKPRCELAGDDAPLRGQLPAYESDGALRSTSLACTFMLAHARSCMFSIFMQYGPAIRQPRRSRNPSPGSATSRHQA